MLIDYVQDVIGSYARSFSARVRKFADFTGLQLHDVNQQPRSHIMRQKQVEMLVVGLLIGVCLVPGGHRQFALWYINLVPFAIEMMGLPWFLTIWMFPNIWPCDTCFFADRW